MTKETRSTLKLNARLIDARYKLGIEESNHLDTQVKMAFLEEQLAQIEEQFGFAAHEITRTNEGGRVGETAAVDLDDDAIFPFLDDDKEPPHAGEDDVQGLPELAQGVDDGNEDTRKVEVGHGHADPEREKLIIELKEANEYLQEEQAQVIEEKASLEKRVRYLDVQIVSLERQLTEEKEVVNRLRDFVNQDSEIKLALEERINALESVTIFDDDDLNEDTGLDDEPYDDFDLNNRLDLDTDW